MRASVRQHLPENAEVGLAQDEDWDRNPKLGEQYWLEIWKDMNPKKPGPGMPEAVPARKEIRIAQRRRAGTKNAGCAGPAEHP